LVIGLWGVSDNLGEVRESLSSCVPDGIVTTFDEAISSIISLSEIDRHVQPSPVEDAQLQAV